MATFLEFLEQKNNIKNSMVSEAFASKDIDNVIDKINKLLGKHINGLIPLVGFVNTIIGKDKFYSKQYIVMGNTPKDSSCFYINWLRSGNSMMPYSISFFKNTDVLLSGNAKANLEIDTLGSSIVYFLPIIWTIVNSGNYNIDKNKAISIGRSIFKSKANESYEYYVGNLRYQILENVSESVIKDTYNLVTESEGMTAKQYREIVKNRSIHAQQNKKESPEAKEYAKKMLDEYNEVTSAIRLGAKTLDDLKLAIKRNVNLIEEIDNELQKQYEEQVKNHEDPEKQFKRMSAYVHMVIKGTTTSVIICGAPGVGKTYRVKQALKAAGYNEMHNLCTIKGKCSPRILYTTLYNFKERGKVVLIDDADSIVGPKAPEDSINILKAATDSSGDDEGRKINYGIAGPLKDEEGIPMPKSFFYNGSVIIITNWPAGKLDTAVKGRAMICDLNLTTEDALQIIKSLMPAIMPDKLSAKAKIKAYDYLVELSKNKANEMEISVRTFGLCSKLYQSAVDGFVDDETAEAMIREQMRLQAARGGKKY